MWAEEYAKQAEDGAKSKAEVLAKTSLSGSAAQSRNYHSFSAPKFGRRAIGMGSIRRFR